MDKLQKIDDEPRTPREDWGGHCQLVSGCTDKTRCAIKGRCAIDAAVDRASRTAEGGR